MAMGRRVRCASEKNTVEPQASDRNQIEYPAWLPPGAWNWKMFVPILQNICKEILKIFCRFSGISMHPLENPVSRP